MHETAIPVCQPSIGQEEKSRVLRVLNSGQLAAGSEVATLEENFQNMMGREAVAVSSGTAALIALMATAKLEKGSLVAVPALTFAASATCLLFNGFVPVFVDIEPHTFNISPQALSEACESYPVKAVVVVHLYGRIASMPRLIDIVRKYDLLLIEDCAQAPGAVLDGKLAGTWGHGAAFSFYATKNMTSGEGGAILTDSPEWAQRIRQYINHGQQERYVHTSLGQNYRMTELQAALANCQFEKLADFNLRRRKIAQKYGQLLAGLAMELPSHGVPGSHVFHQYTVLTTNRDALQKDLAANGIGTSVHYPRPLYQQSVFNKTPMVKLPCPVTESLCPKLLSLPMYPTLTDEQVNRVTKQIRDFHSAIS
ncbi:MAG: DegT/DnrJ/EryC1/StrS family aminotransferase [Heliobacteriaceae bacterium]|nr:DegT/DnrJ/EryC1/StrS family aminotransferase [Heliobacteriaceae bacterium]MDD4587592.1 DegT/DnrJ/EryC1/StrS family aminotransferase [Heliobacteriaceae bacterium]